MSTANGLAGNSISALLQDHSGFIWIGTTSGLSRYNGYGFDNFHHNPEDTLHSIADDEVASLLEDHRGNIWILTRKGLNRFETSTGRITPFQDTLLSRNMDFIYPALAMDHFDRIWIKGYLLRYFDTRTLEYKSVQPPELVADIRQNLVVFLKNPLDDQLYALISGRNAKGVPAGQLYRVDTTQQPQFTWIDSVSTIHGAEGARTACFDPSGNLWLDEPTGGLYRIAASSRKVHFFPARSGIPNDPSKRLGGTLLGITCSNDGRFLWLAGYGGIQRWTLRPDTLVQVQRFGKDKSNPNILPSTIVRCSMEDNSGNLWVGLETGGLAFWSPWKHKFERFYQKGADSVKLADNKTEALFFDHKNRLWIATESGLCRLDNREKQFFKVFTQKKDNHTVGNRDNFTGIHEDTVTNRLYLCYWGSFPNRMHPETGVFEEIRPSNFTAKQWYSELGWTFFQHQIARTPSGKFFYADWDGYLGCFDPKNNTYTQFGEREPGKDWLSCLTTTIWVEDNEHLWVGSDDNKGIQWVDLSKGSSLNAVKSSTSGTPLQCMPVKGQIKQYPVIPGDSTRLQNGVINCLFEDAFQRLWIGTNGGLFQLTDRLVGMFKRYGFVQGFPSESIESIMEDKHRQLWIGTDKGLCLFNPDSNRVLQVFNTSDGLQGDYFLPRSTAQNSYGLMAFGGSNGFNIFHPDSIYTNTLAPKIAILRISANKVDKQIINNRLELPYDSSTLFIELAAMDFSDPKQNLFKYRIEGYEKDYCTPTSNNEVRYINLPPGIHQFHVLACNNDGVWNQEGIWLTIVIRPPFWLTWWFWTLGIGLAFWGMFRYMRWRENVIRRSNLIDYLKVQSLQAQLNPHFLFNVLATMQSRILNNNPEAASRMVVDLSKLMRNFLEATIAMDADKKGPDDAPVRSGINSQEIPLSQELELLEMYIRFEQTKYDQKFQYQIKYDRLDIVPGNETLPPLLLQPYVENAIRHGLLRKEGTEGLLVLHFYKDDNFLVCRIEDNGVGLKNSVAQQSEGILLHKSRGRELVERRVQILNQGKYDIRISPPSDRPEGGTVVEIKIGYR